MKEIIEIKRKEFTVLEQIGEHSFKVERKGKILFLKKYQDKESFNEFVKNQHRLKITAVDTPKLYLFDKNQMISVVDYIEGETMLDHLVREDITDENIFRILLNVEWCMRRERMRIDFHPDNFKFNGKKLFYLPFKYGSFESDYNFVTKDFKFWFPTKELKAYAESKGLSFDQSRLPNEYDINKRMALITVKYYM